MSYCTSTLLLNYSFCEIQKKKKPKKKTRNHLWIKYLDEPRNSHFSSTNLRLSMDGGILFLILFFWNLWLSMSVEVEFFALKRRSIVLRNTRMIFENRLHFTRDLLVFPALLHPQVHIVFVDFIFHLKYR